jgi:Ion transport protein
MYIISMSNYFEFFVFLIVTANSVILSFSGNLFDESYGSTFELINDIFTYTFLLEFIVKIIGIGIKEYYFDITNFVDFSVLVIGFTDIYLRVNSDISSSQIMSMNLAVVRVLRIFRIFRVLRLLRNIQAMRTIMKGLYQSLINIIYVMLFLVIFIFIFMNLGMSLFKESTLFSNHLNTFYTVFSVLSIENWNATLYVLVK